MSNLTLDVGLAYKLKVAFARNGWSEQLIDAACEADKLGQFKQVLLGYATITVVEHAIDCDVQPYTPDGWSVEDHQKGGVWKWDVSQVELYLADSQKNGESIPGHELRKDLAKKPVMNANVLDYLLANPHLIPEEWKDKSVFFWGTIYRDAGGDLCVRCLYWHGVAWDWGYRWLDFDWYEHRPALLRAS